MTSTGSYECGDTETTIPIEGKSDVVVKFLWSAVIEEGSLARTITLLSGFWEDTEATLTENELNQIDDEVQDYLLT